MRRLLTSAFVALVVLAASTAVLASPRAGAASLSYTALSPGGLTPFAETVDVNVVFVGMSPDTSVVDDDFPATASPQTRFKLFYGLSAEADLGITYTYAYDFFDTSSAWEDSLFTYVASIAEAKPRTLFQDEYNAQAGSRDVGQNHWIDAPSVEEWLITNPPAGVDTTKPTMFFINWWGRSDFIDHVYTKIGEPDPDTGNDFGLVRHSRKIVAWGGTAPDDEETGYGGAARRVWFYDMSAGPEAWGGSYEITNADIDGDGARDYRIPAIWEYTGTPLTYNHPGYGSAQLETDIGALACAHLAAALKTFAYPAELTYFLKMKDRLLQHELRETFSFLTREVDTSDLAALPWWRRHPRALVRFFLAVAYRLNPWRRVLFAASMIALGAAWLAFALGLVAQGPFSLAPLLTGHSWLLVAATLLALLLVLELRDKLSLKGDLEIARQIQFGLKVMF